MICIRCKNKNSGWFKSLCKDCELDERRIWLLEHTFKFGDRVEVNFGGGKFCIGTVVGFHEKRSEYEVGHYYNVRYPDGSINLLGNWMLSKIRSRNDPHDTTGSQKIMEE